MKTLTASVAKLNGKVLALLLPLVAALIPWLPSLAVAQSAAVEDQSSQSSQSTNNPSWLHKAESLKLSWGAFDFHPRLRETMISDDNILYSTKNQQQDFINQVAPGIQIVGGDRSSLNTYSATAEEWNQSFDLTRVNPSWLVLQSSENWPDKFMLLDYSPQWQAFSRHSANDSLDQFLRANAVWPMSKLVIGFRQDYRDEKTVVIEALRRGEVEQIHTELDAGYRLNDKFSVDTAFERQDMSYPDTTNMTGYVEWKGTVSLNRQILDTFNASLFVAGGWDEVGTGLDQSFEQLGVRLRYDYSRLFGLDGAVGVEDRAFDSGRSDSVAPFFNLGASYHPWERTYFRVAITRQQYASLNNGYFYTSTGGNLSLRKDFTDRFSLQGDVGYYETDYTPIQNIANNSKPSDYYSMQLTGKVKLLKCLDGSIYCLFRGSGLSQNNSVIQDNQCGVQLALHY